MMKRVLCLMMIAMAFSFAQEGTYIGNICDTLGAKKVELKLQQIEETMWYGSKDLSKADSVKNTVYKDYLDVKPYKGKFSHKLPVSIPAGCIESRNSLFQYATWGNSQWELVVDDNDYATMIMDINQFTFPGYNSSNAYNVLAVRKGSLPEDNAFSSEELMVSKTFEFHFDWWYSLALYYKGATSYSYTSTVAIDSLSAVKSSVKGLGIPDSVSKVQLQIFHGVLVDPNKNQPESSSSEQEISSSSEGTTALGRMEKTPRVFNGSREVRRLDGSVVKQGESLEPGVYYVKGSDGRWKKSVQLH